MQIQFPQHPVVNEPLAQSQNLQVAVFQFPRLAAFQWMWLLRLIGVRHEKEDTRQPILFQELRLHFCNGRGIRCGCQMFFCAYQVTIHARLRRSDQASPNERGEGNESSASQTTEPTKNYFFAPRIASLAALATRNLTTRVAAILMVAPVAGLRPMRAFRFTRTIFPSPGIVKEFLAFL